LIKFGLVGEALKKNIWSLHTINLRQFGEGNHHAIDDKPFGGGDGMVLTAPVLERALLSILPCKPKTAFIYLSPQGPTLDQSRARKMAEDFDEYVFLCGRYAGVDQRFLNFYKFQELSIGDYILSGGELAAAVTIDAVVRHWDGVLGNKVSKKRDSFSINPNLLEAPLFTRPRDWHGMSAPEILLSGDHNKISDWNKFVSVIVTLQKRPELFSRLNLSKNELHNLKSFATQLTQSELISLGITPDIVSRINEEIAK
jgi:tRNA (guanine37-N1)-methyltransferase